MSPTLVWSLVWTVLVLGTLVGAFLLGRRLWRSSMALTHELAQAAQVAGRPAQALDAAATPAPAWVHPLRADDEHRARVRAGLQARRAARHERRAAAHRAAQARWDALWR